MKSRSPDSWMVPDSWMPPFGISRRAWLAAVAAGCCAGFAPRDEPPAPDLPDDETAQARVIARAQKAGLEPFRIGRTPSYIGLGDAPDPFRQIVLRTCEDVALDYFDYYQERGFALHRPEKRMVIVTLADRRSFLAFLGVEVGPNVAGVYSRASNVLVVYDHRVAIDRTPNGRARFANQLSMAHEATHQLTFNTGLLTRLGDVPSCIFEGLATFGEVRRTTGRTAPGLINQERLRNLAYGQRRGHSWIPVSQLLTDDTQLNDRTGDDLGNFGYAESWLLVHFLLKEPGRLPAFRNYLKGIADRTDTAHRLDDARTHLGDLDELDQGLRKYSIRLMKGA
jgi:hypothetical protein